MKITMTIDTERFKEFGNQDETLADFLTRIEHEAKTGGSVVWTSNAANVGVIERGKNLHYVEFRSGNCSMIEAGTREQAKVEAMGLTRIPGDTVRLCRVATQQDIDEFEGMVYHA